MKFVTLKPQPRPFEHHLYCRPYSFRSPDRTRLPGRNGHSCIQARGHDSKPANFTVQPGHLSFLFGGHVGTIAGLNDGRVKSGRIPNQSPEGLILICLSYRKSASVS